MLDSIAEEYVGLLRKHHITDLFNWVVDEVGEEEAATICGIDKETANFWRILTICILVQLKLTF